MPTGRTPERYLTTSAPALAVTDDRVPVVPASATRASTSRSCATWPYDHTVAHPCTSSTAGG
ncbi:MAG TPA: hypothetical protein VFQ85_15330 [Mycobacteriales bacterium]|nr:hypothetical protein [Mycobacteriales bacterium]